MTALPPPTQPKPPGLLQTAAIYAFIATYARADWVSFAELIGTSSPPPPDPKDTPCPELTT